jgi:ketosteroid isomerase-like protein
MRFSQNQRNYNFLFQLRDGKIASGKEFLDAIQVTEIFGAP